MYLNIENYLKEVRGKIYKVTKIFRFGTLYKVLVRQLKNENIAQVSTYALD